MKCSKRGQAVLDSMIVLAASVLLIALLSPAYSFVYDLAYDAQKVAQCRRAASSLHAAARLAKATGAGSEYAGSVQLCDGGKVLLSESGAIEILLSRKTGSNISIPVATDCSLYGSCLKNCSYRAYLQPGCRMELH
ncbi:MAG: hypothetical protein WC408_03365 [Candidatus Micrarchaeia archaeon]|jgi:hypothetical protein